MGRFLGSMFSPNTTVRPCVATNGPVFFDISNNCRVTDRWMTFALNFDFNGLKSTIQRTCIFKFLKALWAIRTGWLCLCLYRQVKALILSENAL